MELTTPIAQKRKREKIKEGLSQKERFRCEYLLPHKNGRQCNMTRKASERFCAQHLSASEYNESGEHQKVEDVKERVKCPLDRTHSVWLQDISRHLKRCRAAKQTPTEIWFDKDCNLLRPEPTEYVPVSEQGITFEEYHKWIAFVEKFYTTTIAGTKFENLPLKKLQHDGVTRRLNELSNKKHAIQQGSLLAILDDTELLATENHYIEFGAGRGELSRYLHQALLHNRSLPKYNPTFLLIDRTGTRMKLDGKIIKDWEDREPPKFDKPPVVKRFKTDIKDLNFIKDSNHILKRREDGSGRVVAISKHLCGAATDLTLKCLDNYIRALDSTHPKSSMPLGGIMIALCCRHRCTYSTYPLQYLDPHANEIDPRGFEILSKMTSWAICGRRPNKLKNTDDLAPNSSDDEHHDKLVTGENESMHVSKLSISYREEIGHKVRAMIDYGRVRQLEHNGVKVELIRYVDKSVSSENVCLLATLD
ncbi:methyltransferase TRM13-domain-containing protein [Lipomyces arxii]|uniref:methyltransferase TRM13-domain-containing protein n=1 Tax=Lipomyces arxii TaxID=56418 RepID=UPI0034CD6465